MGLFGSTGGGVLRERRGHSGARCGGGVHGLSKDGGVGTCETRVPTGGRKRDREV